MKEDTMDQTNVGSEENQGAMDQSNVDGQSQLSDAEGQKGQLLKLINLVGSANLASLPPAERQVMIMQLKQQVNMAEVRAFLNHINAAEFVVITLQTPCAPSFSLEEVAEALSHESVIPE